LVLSIPGIAQGLAGLADCDDFAGLAEDGGVFDDAKFAKIGSPPRSRFGGTQGEKLRDVDEEQGRSFRLGQAAALHAH